MPPINVEEVRQKIATRQRVTTDEIKALFEAEGLLAGYQVIPIANGFLVILGPPEQRQQRNQADQQLGPRIEVTENRLRGIGMRGNREFEQQLALMARVRFGEGATVGVRGGRHLRAACRELGLVVVNTNNPATIAWSFARNTIVLRRLPRRSRPHRPAPAAAAQPGLA